MPEWAISLALKVSPYLLVALVAFGAGNWTAHRFDQGTINAAKLALSQQQLQDAKSIAHDNQKAVQQISAETVTADNVLAAHQGRTDAGLEAEANQRAGIAATAAKPGQDAPVAPVLAATLLEIQGGAK